MAAGLTAVALVGVTAAFPATRAAPTGRIVFGESSIPCPSGHCRTHISLIGADGSHRHMLTTSKDPVAAPRWSPDGKRLIFEAATRRGCCALEVMDDRGQGLRQLTKLGSVDPAYPASWAADGKSALYVQTVARQKCSTCRSIGRYYLVAVNVRGRPRPRRLFALPGTTDRVSWQDQAESPNGRWIAVGKSTFGRTAQADAIWLVHPDGAGLHRLVSVADGDFGAFSWSADSTRLAYVAYFPQTDCPGGTGEETDRFDTIWVVPAAGGTPEAMWNMQCVDSPAPTDFLPDEVSSIAWGPDGEHIVYASPDFAPSNPYTPANEAKFGLVLHMVDTQTGAITGVPNSLPSSNKCHGPSGSADVPCGLADPDWTR